MKKKSEAKTSKKKPSKVTAKENEKESEKNVVGIPQETKTEEVNNSEQKNNNEQEKGTLDKGKNKSEHQFNLNGTVDEYDKERKTMLDQHSVQIQDLNKKCTRKLKKKEKEFDEKINDLDRKLTLELIPSEEPIDYDKVKSEIEDLRQQKKSELEEIKKSFEEQLESLKEKQKKEEEQLERKSQDSIARQKEEEEAEKNKRDFIATCARIDQNLSAFWNVVLDLKHIKDKKLWLYADDEQYKGFEDFMSRRFGFHRSYYSQLNSAYTIWLALKEDNSIDEITFNHSAGFFFELSKIRKDGEYDFDEIKALFKELKENGTLTIADVKKRVRALLPEKTDDDKFIGNANKILTLARKLNAEKLDRQKLNIDQMPEEEKIELKKIFQQMCDMLS